MSEFQLVKYCSPTLAGFKIGNIVNCTFDNESQLYEDLARINSMVNHKGIYLVLLKSRGNKALVYVYRPEKLALTIKNSRVQEILRRSGYRSFKVSCLINHLRRKLSMTKSQDEFPHEIGIFLGYPIDDVVGFLENRGKNYLLTGPWKVYGDVCSAKCTFDKHRKCTRLYCQMLSKGTPISRLAVNV